MPAGRSQGQETEMSGSQIHVGNALCLQHRSNAPSNSIASNSDSCGSPGAQSRAGRSPGPRPLGFSHKPFSIATAWSGPRSFPAQLSLSSAERIAVSWARTRYNEDFSCACALPGLHSGGRFMRNRYGAPGAREMPLPPARLHISCSG
jgi:hypothetical protein